MKGVFIYFDSDCGCELLATVSNKEDAEVLKHALRQTREEIGPGRSKPVIVLEVLPEAQKYVDFKSAKPCEVGQKFPSALRASQWLGYPGSDNPVGNALGRERREHRKTTATVRGVVFQLLEDYGAE
jgi:hypothetical protein